MYQRQLVASLFFCAAAYACGTDVTATQDCATLTTLASKCGGFAVEGITEQNCGQILYYLPSKCQAALHDYLGCAGSQTCAALDNPNHCVAQQQALAVACNNGNASITAVENGNVTTKARAIGR